MHKPADLFQLQIEHIDGKVDMSVSKAILPVLEKMESFKQEMHREIRGLRQEMHQEIGGLRNELHTFKDEMNQRFTTIDQRFSGLEGRMIAVETALGLQIQMKNEIRSRYLDYSFKAGWVLVVGSISLAVSFLYAHFHTLLQ